MTGLDGPARQLAAAWVDLTETTPGLAEAVFADLAHRAPAVSAALQALVTTEARQRAAARTATLAALRGTRPGALDLRQAGPDRRAMAAAAHAERYPLATVRRPR